MPAIVRAGEWCVPAGLGANLASRLPAELGANLASRLPAGLGANLAIRLGACLPAPSLAIRRTP